MSTRVRRLILIAGTALGLVASSAAPAAAGATLLNHCPPDGLAR